MANRFSIRIRLEANGGKTRSPWFGVACCPGNITRFMASVPGYVYAEKDDAIWVNLYMANHADIKLDNGRTVNVVQETRYPWDGSVKMTVNPDQSGPYTVHVRIPGWARNEPVPSDLYRFTDKSGAAATLRVNGKAVPLQVDKGYVTLTREWKKGDTIDLNLPMSVRRVAANEQVADDRGRVSLQRGPVVYAAEWVDSPSGKVRNLMLPDGAILRAQPRPDLLNGVTVIKGHAVALSRDERGRVHKSPQDFTAIPYYAWANRGKGQMMVWIPDTEVSADPAPFPIASLRAKVTTSGRKDAEPIHDGEVPAKSIDNASYFDWWPIKGTTEWVEYTFAKPTTVSDSELFWFDDTGRGEVRVPAGWRVLYKDGGQWKPVESPGPYGIERDQFNRVAFKPVTTTGLRLEVAMQPNFSAGLQEWKVK